MAIPEDLPIFHYFWRTNWLLLFVDIFSIIGENKHYGTPTNPAAQARVPGGSSSGAAVAVAAGLVDFSLGELICFFVLLSVVWAHTLFYCKCRGLFKLPCIGQQTLPRKAGWRLISAWSYSYWTLTWWLWETSRLTYYYGLMVLCVFQLNYGKVVLVFWHGNESKC